MSVAVEEFIKAGGTITKLPDEENPKLKITARLPAGSDIEDPDANVNFFLREGKSRRSGFPNGVSDHYNTSSPYKTYGRNYVPR